MAQNFMAVFQQVVILFILIGVGFVCGKLKVFDKESIKKLSTFVLYCVTPCVVISAFDRPFEHEMFRGLLIAFAAAVFFHLFNVIIATLCLHDKDINKQKVLHFGMVFSNCGYMAIPLQQSLIGSDGLFYSAVFIAVFNIVNWTYGAIMMSHEKNASISKAEKQKQIGQYVKKGFLNPGVISFVIGLAVYFMPFPLAHVIISPISSLASLNTPLPMVIIGFYLSQITSFAVLKKFNFWLDMILRLIVSPVIFIIVLYVCGVRGALFATLAIASCTPSAANTVMFATLFNRDTTLASELVTISTLFSIITMPIIISVSMSLM